MPKLSPEEVIVLLKGKIAKLKEALEKNCVSGGMVYAQCIYCKTLVDEVVAGVNEKGENHVIYEVKHTEECELLKLLKM